MRKGLLILLLASVLCLCACGKTQDTVDERMITMSANETAESHSEITETFCFYAGNVKLIPGEVFDASLLEEPVSTYQVPSCAIEGTDNIYNYGSYEITAFDDGKQEILYSIYFLDAAITTPEGLALGDSAEKITELYGESASEDLNVRDFESSNVILSIILQEGKVASIEYRMSDESLKVN